jgi:hypothetical protein
VSARFASLIISLVEIVLLSCCEAFILFQVYGSLCRVEIVLSRWEICPDHDGGLQVSSKGG